MFYQQMLLGWPYYQLDHAFSGLLPCLLMLAMSFLIVGTRIHCQESGEESSEAESVYSLKCHISQEVNHLHEGLKHVSGCCFQQFSIWNVFCLPHWKFWCLCFLINSAYGRVWNLNWRRLHPHWGGVQYTLRNLASTVYRGICVDTRLLHSPSSHHIFSYEVLF